MWISASLIAAAAWLFFGFRARRLAQAIDRAEVALLKPLSITYLSIGVAAALSRAWIVAVVCALAWLLNGIAGASLHPSNTVAELAEGTFDRMRQGPRMPLSPAESRRVAALTLRAAALLGVVLSVFLVHYSWPWYFALPVAFVAAWVLLFASTILIAYRRTPTTPGAAAG